MKRLLAFLGISVALTAVAWAAMIRPGEPAPILYVAPLYVQVCQEEAMAGFTPEQRRAAEFVCAQPHSFWIAEWIASPAEFLEEIFAGAEAAGAIPTIVLYNIPGRDCSLYAAQEGVVTSADYLRWIGSVADAIGNHHVSIILEPDALAQIATVPDCMAALGWQEERLRLIAFAASMLGENPNAKVYIDAGNAAWVGARQMAGLLARAGIEHAAGFALNVSNRVSTTDSILYGHEISNLVGNKGFVIDTSRNGAGLPSLEGEAMWCNPPTEALGDLPTFDTGDPLIHAFLWVKAPGESDGECLDSPEEHRGPPAGDIWPERLQSLFERSVYAQ